MWLMVKNIFLSQNEILKKMDYYLKENPTYANNQKL